MNNAPAADGSDEAFLAQFVLALESDHHDPTVVERFCRRRPDLSDEIRQLAALNRQLNAVAARLPAPLPQRLGEFHVLRLIAAGGMGEIYEAEQESLDRRRVAIKVIRRGHVSGSALARFEREQKVLARLHQTHIVPVYSAGQQEGVAFFVMPFIRGASLREALDTGYAVWEKNRAALKLSELAALAIDQPAARRGSRSPRCHLGSNPLKLPSAYYRSVAAVMADAAEAVADAHRASIIHRDLKPSNIMLDAVGHCWIIDFGLAGAVADAGTSSSSTIASARDGDQTVTGLLGTIPYLAPEQLQGSADERSDVYGLGATLYELLTWRPPFFTAGQAVRELIAMGAVDPPRKLAPNVAPDMQTICLKALSKSPAERYASALEFAEDLRRWLRHEPICARRVRTPRRVLLWTRRNPGWAAAIGVAVLLLMVFVGSQALWLRRAEQTEAALMVASIDRSSRGTIDGRDNPKGWFEPLWQNEIRPRANAHSTPEVRNAAAAALVGLDALQDKRFERGGSSLAFDGTGRLLVGGVTAQAASGEQAQPAFEWDATLTKAVPHALDGEGPVAYASGRPLQLVTEGHRLLLWDLASDELIREVDFPDSGQSIARLALSADGSLLAAAGHKGETTGLVAVWSAMEDHPVLRLDVRASALAISPDNAFLALGDGSGSLRVYEVNSGQTVFGPRKFDRVPITALAFGRDPHVRRDVGLASRWLFASGDASATVILWDLGLGSPRAHYRGGMHHVHALAFSPDATMLSVVGRGDVLIHDTATGRLLLRIHESNWLSGVAFAPDGQTIAVSSLSRFDDPGKVTIWRLQNGRGVTTLFGLGSQVEKVLISPDERYLAALSHDSRVAIWDLAVERLLHIWEAPPTDWVDNAALTFSPNSGQLAFSGGSDSRGEVRVWDIATGDELAAWSVGGGRNRVLAAAGENLFLFQVEKGVENGRWSVGRFYKLERDMSAVLLHEISRFHSLQWPTATEDGRLLVLLAGDGGQSVAQQQVLTYDMTTGKELPAVCRPDSGPWHDPQPQLDRDGQFLIVTESVAGTQQRAASLARLPDGPLVPLSEVPWSNFRGWSPNMPYWCRIPDNFEGIAIVPRGRWQPAVHFNLESRPSGTQFQFGGEGRLLAWGNRDGTVHVCEMDEVRRRLEEIGLAW